MPNLARSAVLGLALATVAASLTLSGGAAEAKWGHHGAFAGALAGGLVLGIVSAAMIDAAEEPEAEGRFHYRRVCRMEPRYDETGAFIGRVRVCRTSAY